MTDAVAAPQTRKGRLELTLRALVLGCLLAVIFAALGLSVEWIYAALVGDYALKGWMLTRRFRSGRWRNLQLANSSAA